MFKIIKLIYFEENGYKKFGWKQEEVDNEIKATSLFPQHKVIKVEEDGSFTYTSVEELKSYIKMSFGLDYKEIVSIWSENVPLFEVECSKDNLFYKEGDGKYLMELCKIIDKEKDVLIENKKISII